MKNILTTLGLATSVFFLVFSIACNDTTDGPSPDTGDATNAMDAVFEVPNQEVGDAVTPDAVEDPGPGEVVDEPIVDDAQDMSVEVVQDAELDRSTTDFNPDEEIICPPGEALEMTFEPDSCVGGMNVDVTISMVNANLSSLLAGSAGSMAFLDDSELSTTVLEGMMEAGENCDDPEDPPDCVEGIDWSAPEDGATELNTQIEEEILVLEADDGYLIPEVAPDGCSIMFELDTFAMCDDDEDCPFREVPIKFFVWTPFANALYIEMLVGEMEYNPIDAFISADRLFLVVDLEQVHRSMYLFSMPDVPEFMAGILELDLTRTGDSEPFDFFLSAAIREQIDFMWTFREAWADYDEDPFAAEFHLAPACPFLEVGFMPAAGEAIFNADFAAIEMILPMALIEDAERSCDDGETGTYGEYGDECRCDATHPCPAGSIEADFAGGMSMFGHYVNVDDTLSLSAFGFGGEPGVVSARIRESAPARPVAEFSINPGLVNPEFSAVMKITEDYFNIEIEPEFHVETIFNFQRLPPNMEDPPELLMDGEEMHGTLVADPLPSILRINTIEGREMLEVFHGHLTLESILQNITVVVEEGECLVNSDVEVDHPFQALDGGACVIPPE